MNHLIRRATTVAAGFAVATGAALTLAAAPVTAATGSGPAWEPDGNAVGTLTFYDAGGKKITGGSLSASPLAAYVQGSAVENANDSKATLYAYTPTTQSPGNWDCHDKVMGATDYPNSAAPGALGSSSLPVVTGHSGDLSLASFVQDCPNKLTDPGYQNFYQLRLVTSGPGHVGDPTTDYDAVDIVVSGSSWSLASAQTKVLTNTSKPTLSGKRRVGKPETCHHGSWTPSPASYGYKWYVGSKRITGATHHRFTPTKKYAGKHLSCKVTAHLSGYQSVSARSAAVKIRN